MQNKSLTILVIILATGLVLLNTACGTGIDEEAFQNALDTAVAETATAKALDLQRTKGAEVAIASTETTAPANTNTPVLVTPTPEPTLTATIEVTAEVGSEGTVLPEFTLTGPAVQVSVDTNCRSGPGKVYPYLGGLFVGEEAVIVGKDPSGAYWYITNPDQEGGYCWIWGAYAVISGNTAPLPIYTPGPTPIPGPNFSVAYREVESCGGAWQVEFEIFNNGVLDHESVSTFVQDTITGAQSGNSSINSFSKMSGCTVDETHDRRAPGDTGFTVSLDLSNNPTGHLTYASITVCTQDNLDGYCRTRELYFTP